MKKINFQLFDQSLSMTILLKPCLHNLVRVWLKTYQIMAEMIVQLVGQAHALHVTIPDLLP